MYSQSLKINLQLAQSQKPFKFVSRLHKQGRSAILLLAKIHDPASAAAVRQRDSRHTRYNRAKRGSSIGCQTGNLISRDKAAAAGNVSSRATKGPLMIAEPWWSEGPEQALMRPAKSRVYRARSRRLRLHNAFSRWIIQAELSLGAPRISAAAFYFCGADSRFCIIHAWRYFERQFGIWAGFDLVGVRACCGPLDDFGYSGDLRSGFR